MLEHFKAAMEMRPEFSTAAQTHGKNISPQPFTSTISSSLQEACKSTAKMTPPRSAEEIAVIVKCLKRPKAPEVVDLPTTGADSPEIGRDGIHVDRRAIEQRFFIKKGYERPK